MVPVSAIRPQMKLGPEFRWHCSFYRDGLRGWFLPSLFDDPHKRATTGALVQGLVFDGFPSVLASIPVGHVFPLARISSAKVSP